MAEFMRAMHVSWSPVNGPEANLHWEYNQSL